MSSGTKQTFSLYFILNIYRSEGTICVNTEGNYTCDSAEDFAEDNPCPVGFQEQGGKCEDINECQTGQHDCLESQRCDNTLGSFLCVRFTTCGTGYTLNYGQKTFTFTV